MKHDLKRTALFAAIYISVLLVTGVFIFEVRPGHSSEPPATVDKAAKVTRDRAEREYEQWYWDQQRKDPENFPRIIGRVALPGGGSATGRLLFIRQCPKDLKCAQPDESFTDATKNPNELSGEDTDE